jgi:hypothetical protein
VIAVAGCKPATTPPSNASAPATNTAKPAANANTSTSNTSTAAPPKKAPEGASAQNKPELKSTETADGQTWYDEDGGYQFTTPKGWTTEGNEDAYVSRIISPDDSVAIDIYTSDTDDANATGEDLGEWLGSSFENLKFDDDKGKDIQTPDGMTFHVLGANATYEGEPQRIVACIIEAKRPVVLVLFGPPDKMAGNASAFRDFVNSIKRYKA